MRPSAKPALAAVLWLAPSAGPARPVVWLDDFLGAALDRRYSAVAVGQASVDMEEGPGHGGALRLAVGGGRKGIAKVRFGEDGGTSGLDVRNWSVRHEVEFQARVLFDTGEDMEATVGLVGLNDPDNVLAARFHSVRWARWRLQAKRAGRGITTSDKVVRHVPHRWTDIRIATTWRPVPRAVLSVGTSAPIAVGGGPVPDTGLCVEFQLWNIRRADGSWSRVRMWVDHVRIAQRRLPAP